MAVIWQPTQVSSPHIAKPVECIAAKYITYTEGGHRFETLHIYVPKTSATTNLVGKPATSIPELGKQSSKPRCHVHIHGGAWRDPFLTADSVEPLVACAFSSKDSPIDVIVGINYTLSPFPTHPTAPYDPEKGDTGQPWREAKHPDHVRDALMAFRMLRSMGLADDQYLLSGHSCGACIAFQTILQDPKHWNLNEDLPAPPRAYALIGLNGLYDLDTLVNGLGPAHKSMRHEYEMFQSIAFGKDKSQWSEYSPARFDADMISRSIEDGLAPKRIVLDQSTEDQLVPVNQLERLKIQLEQVSGLQLWQGNRCAGSHAAPWEQGYMIWQTILDVLEKAD